jgi:hypothetical protein
MVNVVNGCGHDSFLLQAKLGGIRIGDLEDSSRVVFIVGKDAYPTLPLFHHESMLQTAVLHCAQSR